MENRSRKRDELTDQLPADKRVCSSSPNSSVQTQMNNSASESPDCEMEATSSSASVSGRSEGEGEKDSASGCDSDDMDEPEQRHKIFRDYYHRRSSLDQGKIRRIATSLKEEAGPGSQLAGLTELCDVLSFSTEELPSSSADLLAPVLIALAKQENNPDIMLLSIRCITYLCDALTRSSGILVRHDVIPALCSRLMTIEYLDVAEQCLQALEKISRDHPLACLEAGVIMAALNYIDFFCTSIQRVALGTVANVCKRLPSDRASLLMEAVPILCNLLNYEDQKLVEIVATCLIRIVDRVRHSPEMLEELCSHGLIHQATHLIEFNGRSPLSQPVYTGLIGLLCRLASGSVSAVRTLLELNISSTLSHILSSYDFTRPPVSVVGGEQCNQVHELMKLLNELLPPLTRNSEDPAITSEKEKILGDQPELLRQFGVNILPVLIQVVNSGVNLYMCYCCLSHIRKIVHFSRPDMLLEFLKNTNISSFLAGAFTRKDRHVLILILEIVENILKKLPDVFMNSFIKEGVVYAIDALLIPGNCSEFSFPISACVQFSSGSTQKSVTKDAFRCLCYAFDVEKSPSPGTTMCKLEKDCVLTSAMRIKDGYFATESHNSGVGLPENLLKLKNLCSLLVEKVHDGSMVNDICVQQEENLSHIVGQMLTLLNAGEYMSTFEFIESGIVRSLVTYLSNDHYMKQDMDQRSYSNSFDVILSRLEKFARYSFLSGGQNWEGMPIAILIKKLQSALSSLENFPVILSHGSKSRNTYATIPFGRCTLNPCLKVRFVREEGEMDLCDYSADVATVEPFSTLYDIEKFLLPKVSAKRVERCAKLVDQSTDQQKATPVQGPSSSCSPQSEDQSLKETDNASPCAADAQQEVKAQLSSTPEEAVDNVPGEASLYLGQPPVAVTEDLQTPVVVTSPKLQDSAKTTTSTVAICSRNNKGSGSTPCNDGDVLPKLSFYLKGKQIGQESTLFQAILQQKVKEEHEVVVGPGFWNEVYQVTYRKAAEPKNNPVESLSGSQISSAQGSHPICPDIPFFYSIFASELCCGVEKSEPTYEILFLLKILEGVNRFAFQLLSQERKRAFSNGELENLDDLVVMTPTVPPTEFVNIKLTEKLEQQMRDQLAVSTSSIPSWCCQLMVSCPYLFGFEAKSKYFRQVVFGSLHGQPQLWSHAVNSNSISPTHRNSHGSGLRRKKFQVSRSHILDSAAKMMEQHAQQKTLLEVEYNEEVGTGLGPTMEFYTLVSHEFQKVGLGMWRGDHTNFTSEKESMAEDSGLLLAPLGFFPRPLSHTSNSLSESQSMEVMKKFVLLGQIVAKTLQDGRVLDLLFSKAFYKLILEQELNIYDIQSIDPQLGRTLLEFQALTDMKRVSHCVPGMPLISDSCFRNTKIEDLWLDFTLPGYPDYMLSSGDEHKMVNFLNLEEYVSSVVDATVSSGISRQVEAFKSGFNQVFPITSLRIFTEGELERLLCGEQDAWTSEDLLEHIKFDHGYTVSSPPIVNLLEIVQDFNYDQKRAFLQFVTGAPRLPPGGLAALNPQLTVVRKHCSECVDGDLPSVMTCANYLKLPPYSSKERMRERLLFAITEGQGSFHLS